MPKAYLLVEHIVTDAATFSDYLRKVGPMIAKHGGRALTKGNAHRGKEVIESRLTEFPDMKVAQRLVSLA
jgi:uncharacterized protein (DUF1330 family)